MPTTIVFGDAADGWIRGQDATYATARSTAFTSNSVNTDAVVGQDPPATYRCYEAFLAFDTSGITGVISSADLALASAADNSATNFIIECRKRDWGPTLELADWVAGASLDTITPLVATYDIAASGWAGFGYHTFTDVAMVANINQAGFTRFLLNSDRHRLGTVPTTLEQVSFATAENTGTSVDPKLTIVHEDAPGPAEFYVSPTGSAVNDGSATSPWSLAHALSHPGTVDPGDTIWLRAGTYTVGPLTSTLTGTATDRILVRQYPGERAIIDGDILVNGPYVWFWGFEIYDSDLTIPNRQLFSIHAAGVKVINCIVHDGSGVGVGTWGDAPDGEVYGCLVYNNGREGSNPDSRGHGFYFQNVTGFKRLYENICFNNYAYNFHGYTSTGGLDNIDMKGNASFNAGQYSIAEQGGEYLVLIDLGGTNGINGFIFTENYCYKSDGGGFMGFGLQSGVVNLDFVFTNNYLDGRLALHEWSSGTFTGNTFANPLSSTPFGTINFRASTALTNFNWETNTYQMPLAGANPWIVFPGGGFATLAGWQGATGFDDASTHSHPPTGQAIFVRPNTYEAKRGHVIVFNWSGAATAAVDLSTILAVGDEYEIREVQDFFGQPVLTGTYAGGTVAVPMDAVTAPPPLGPTDFPAISTGNQFHAFVVLPTGQVPSNQFTPPIADVTDGLWLNQAGSNVDLYAAVDEQAADDTDYIQSSLDPTSDAVELRFEAIGTPGPGPGTLHIRHRRV
jgi:hypothetical protein